jgi:hypothetical protein
VRANEATWLTLPDFGQSLSFSFSLDPPTERQAQVDTEAAVVWKRGWQGFPQTPGIRLSAAVLHWPSLGRQEIPQRVAVAGVAALNEAAGCGPAWMALCARARRLVAELGEPVRPKLGTVASRLRTMQECDLGRLVAVVQWLVNNPASGLGVRELPIEGVDTKWVERHRGMVGPLVEGLTGSPELGLRQAGRRFTVRILYDIIEHSLRDFTASVDELRTLSFNPQCVLITENLAPLRRMGELPGAIVIHGCGGDVVELADVPWVRDSPIWYWGDLDSHGFRILGLARKTWPQVKSILMDDDTYDRFASLVVPEPRPFRGHIGYLTGPEQMTLAKLCAHDSRLEQERISWAWAWTEINRKLESDG